MLVILFGCAATQQSNVGRTALKRHILSADETTSSPQAWQTNDLTVFYTVEQKGAGFSVSGSLEVKDNITSSFPLVERFILKINYLDHNDTVIATHDITPNIGYKKKIPEDLVLRDIPMAPANAVSFVFSYWAVFTGLNNPDESTGDWLVHFEPFKEK
jgi:hypothetical protein